MNPVFQETFSIEKMDFVAAGEAASTIKARLRSIGIDSKLIRRVAIATYEAEMNMIIHSDGGVITFMVEPSSICISCDDTGPGIADISLAMQEGYSTAPDYVRIMGFGAGMGLPNIKRSCDAFSIESSVEGTHMCMRFEISPP